MNNGFETQIDEYRLLCGKVLARQTGAYSAMGSKNETFTGTPNPWKCLEIRAI